MKLFLLLSSVFLLSFSGDNTVNVKTDGFYVGKVTRIENSKTIEEFHYIYFHADGTAETFKFPSLDLAKVYSIMKSKKEADFSGSYIIQEGNIIYRSNNTMNKKEKPEVALFHSYHGKMNSKEQIVFNIGFTTEPNTECTFDYYKFPKE